MPVDKFNMGGNGGCGAAQSASWGSPVGLVHRAGDTMLGELSLGGFQLKDVGNPLDSSDAATKEYVDTRDVLPLSGGSMRGALHMGGNEIAGLADPQTDQSAASKKYVDTLVISTTDLLDAKVDLLPVELVHRAGDTMLGDLSLGGFQLKAVANPLDSSDAATKEYVDGAVSTTKEYVNTRVDSGDAATKEYVDGAVRATREYVNTRVDSGDAATKEYVDGAVSATREYVNTRDVLQTSGGSMSGALHMGGNEITGLADPKTDQNAASKKYVDTLVISTMDLLDAKVLQLDGSKAPTHDIRWGNHRISDLADPKSDQDAATKAFVENTIHGELERAAGQSFELYEISLQWALSRSLSITPWGHLQFTQNPRNEGDRKATLDIREHGVYKIQLVGLRTGSNRESIDISLHIGPPLALVLQHTITGYIYFNTSGVIDISQPASLQLALASVPTGSGNNIAINAKLLLEKLW